MWPRVSSVYFLMKLVKNSVVLKCGTALSGINVTIYQIFLLKMK